MTIENYLINSTATLSKADIPSARLDCLVLMEDIIGKDRAWLLAHPEYKLSAAARRQIDAMIERRRRHEPLAYIRSKTEFYGRDFYVDSRVLEPRPESEAIIDLLKGLARSNRQLVVDVGSGSGALAVTAKLELPHSHVLATDIDPACLDVAERNSRQLGAEVRFHQADLLAATGNQSNDPAAYSWLQPPLDEQRDQSFVILANLPYVPDSFTINQAAMNEPRLAIFGGPDGLDLYRRLFAQLSRLPRRPDYVITESLPPHHADLAEIASAHGYRMLQELDFIQAFAVAATKADTTAAVQPRA